MAKHECEGTGTILEIADHFDVARARSTKDTISRICDVLEEDMSLLISKDGPFYIDEWNDTVEAIGMQRRRSYEAIRLEIEDWFRGDEDEQQDDEDDEDEQQDDEDDEDNQFSYQGRPEHQRMQRYLAELGSTRGHIVRTNHSIGSGFKPDVLWFRVSPEAHRAAPVAVFEIEFGDASGIAKSLSALKHAHDLSSQRLFLILPQKNIVKATTRVPGAFHEIQRSLHIHAIEALLPLNHYELLKRLKL